MNDHARGIWRSNRGYFLIAAVVSITALLVAAFLGIPIPKAGRLEGVHSLVVGAYSPRERLLVPDKVITNSEEVSRYIEQIAVAPQRLVLPTLGTMRGPVVFLDRKSDPIAAAFYQEEHKALVFYNVEKVVGAFKIENERLMIGGAFQRVFNYNLFDDASGKWQALVLQKANSQ